MSLVRKRTRRSRENESFYVFNSERGRCNCFEYKGISASQVATISEAFTEGFLSGFDRIIELGYHKCGFSLFLADSATCEVFSYDILSPNPEAKADNLNLIQKDLYAQNTINEIILLIKGDGRTLLLCDGGDKCHEFGLFSPHLKPDDVIMLHDYADNLKDYSLLQEKQKWFFGHESSRHAITKYIIKNNLRGFQYQLFKEYFWGSFKKE